MEGDRSAIPLLELWENDENDTFPDIAAQWHPTKNHDLTPEPAIAAQWDTEHNGVLRPDQVTVGSGKRVWWKCNEGHVWKAKVYSRTGKMGSGCPVCAGVAKRNTTRCYHVFENQ